MSNECTLTRQELLLHTVDKNFCCTRWSATIDILCTRLHAALTVANLTSNETGVSLQIHRVPVMWLETATPSPYKTTRRIWQSCYARALQSTAALGRHENWAVVVAMAQSPNSVFLQAIIPSSIPNSHAFQSRKVVSNPKNSTPPTRQWSKCFLRLSSFARSHCPKANSRPLLLIALRSEGSIA